MQQLLRRYHDAQTAAELWEKIRLLYCGCLEDENGLLLSVKKGAE